MPKVVDDRECQQERAELARCPPAGHTKHSQRERDVGRNRNRPATQLATVEVDRDVDDCRAEHRAERGGGRNRGSPPVAQRPEQQLTLALERDDVEEDRHQQVIDDVAQVLL